MHTNILSEIQSYVVGLHFLSHAEPDGLYQCAVWSRCLVTFLQCLWQFPRDPVVLNSLCIWLRMEPLDSLTVWLFSVAVSSSGLTVLGFLFYFEIFLLVKFPVSQCLPCPLAFLRDWSQVNRSCVHLVQEESATWTFLPRLKSWHFQKWTLEKLSSMPLNSPVIYFFLFICSSFWKSSTISKNKICPLWNYKYQWDLFR